MFKNFDIKLPIGRSKLAIHFFLAKFAKLSSHGLLSPFLVQKMSTNVLFEIRFLNVKIWSQLKAAYISLGF